MARNISEIKEQIAAAYMASEGVRKLYGFKGTEVFSKVFPAVCVESVLLYVFAYGMWVIENLFDRHREQVESDLSNLKPHTLRWYINKAKAFQIGDELPTDESGQPISDTYAVIDPKKQIVRYAVADERDGTVLLKLAKYRTMDDHRPDSLQDREQEAVRRYFSQIKDAGVPVAIMSNPPDTMLLNMTIYYNAMLLHHDTKNAEKDLYNSTAAKGLVRAAVEQVIENLPFNGICKRSDIEKAVRGINGVDVADITLMQTARAVEKDQPKSYSNVAGFCIPESGYFKLDKLNLTLEVYEHGNQI